MTLSLNSLAAASALIAAAMLASPSPSFAAEKLKAVATFSILGDMVHRVGGDLVEVTTIVGPNSDTHVYEPKPADAKSLAGAQVFFANGLGFEGWMERLVEATGFKGETVIASDGVKSRAMIEDGVEETDPHAWQNLSNGLLYVKNITDGLCKADAAHCDTFRANAKAYSAEIESLDKEVKARIAAVPEAKRKVITTHDAFGYFGAAYGVTFLAPEGYSTESEASAADVAKLIQQIRDDKISALFIENMSDPRLIDQIARETGVKAGGALFADALSEKGEGGETYLDMFKHNISLLAPAMAGS
ncbi:metal ABC transporter substrate-binding protein [Taklimakanibacter lacteus]|uniref:metal ABC transporter substrate-binding protein n=1 Tax=Taklimakanibacter lacteus TaxID=2268456 RepID=UPI000E65ECCA